MDPHTHDEYSKNSLISMERSRLFTLCDVCQNLQQTRADLAVEFPNCAQAKACYDDYTYAEAKTFAACLSTGVDHRRRQNQPNALGPQAHLDEPVMA